MSNTNPHHAAYSCVTSAKRYKMSHSSLFKAFFYTKLADLGKGTHTHTHTSIPSIFYPVIFNVKAEMQFPRVKAQILKMKENG